MLEEPEILWKQRWRSKKVAVSHFWEEGALTLTPLSPCPALATLDCVSSVKETLRRLSVLDTKTMAHVSISLSFLKCDI